MLIYTSTWKNYETENHDSNRISKLRVIKGVEEQARFRRGRSNRFAKNTHLQTIYQSCLAPQDLRAFLK